MGSFCVIDFCLCILFLSFLFFLLFLFLPFYWCKGPNGRLLLWVVGMYHLKVLFYKAPFSQHLVAGVGVVGIDEVPDGYEYAVYFLSVGTFCRYFVAEAFGSVGGAFERRSKVGGNGFPERGSKFFGAKAVGSNGCGH